MKKSDLRKMIREEIIGCILEFGPDSHKDMPNGTAWKVAGKGWAAKNNAGRVNYWYGKEEVKNKENASKFAKGSEPKPEPKKI